MGLKFLICPDCGGRGIKENHFCDRCQGRGVVLFLRDKVLYWGQTYDRANRVYEKISSRIKITLNLLLALWGLSGLTVLFYFGYKENFISFGTWDYWFTPSPEKLYFWLALLGALFLYYRLDQEGSEKFQVIKKEFRPRTAEISGGLEWSVIAERERAATRDAVSAFTLEARQAVLAGWNLARQFHYSEVNRAHLLGVLTQFSTSAIIWARLGINLEDFRQKVGHYLANHKQTLSSSDTPRLGAEMHKLLLSAYEGAYQANRLKVDLLDVVLALASPEKTGLAAEAVDRYDAVGEILADWELNYQKVKNVVAWLRIQQNLRENLQRFRKRAQRKPKSGMDRAMTAIATPWLNHFGEDLTLQARSGRLFPCIGRDAEIEQAFRIMEGSREGVLLVGNQGVGRTTILHGLAQRMVAEDVPPILRDKRLVSLSVSQLLAGVNLSQAEERLLTIADEVSRAGNIVLAVENLQDLVNANPEAGMGIAEVLGQILARHLFYIIATSTPQAQSRIIEGKEWSAQFQTVKVEELDINSAICVLEARSGPIEYQNQVYFSYAAIEKAVVLSDRYLHERYLPDKAIEVLEQTAVKVKKEQPDKKVIQAEDVAVIISERTKVPVTKVTEAESDKLLRLEDRIHERMVGQEEAVQIVAASLRRSRAELREGTRPMASLLFLGPTGVGKTELAKAVAEVYFGNEKNMVRFDMSEYQDVASLRRLIGSSEGPGYLTEAVRKEAFSLVLFDEIEKAHPDILNLFLQMMDDGRLTDFDGRLVDFTNTIIIMTSNAAAQFIQDQINAGMGLEETKRALLNRELKSYFRPEFLNRFDGVVVFRPLTLREVIQIARLLIRKIEKQLEDKGIMFVVSDEALAELAEKGFDPQFGARPLRRVIQQTVDDVLASALLKGEIKRRDKVVLEMGGKLRIEKAPSL